MNGKKERRPEFQYMCYVLPNEECVKKAAKEIISDKGEGLSKLEMARSVCTWISNNINHVLEAEQGLHPCRVLREKRGRCLTMSILATSILRKLGFDENEIAIIVMLHKGEDPFKALHASTIITDLNRLSRDSNTTILDPSKNFFQRVTLERLLSTNLVILVFNDKLVLTPNDLQSRLSP